MNRLYLTVMLPVGANPLGLPTGTPEERAEIEKRRCLIMDMQVHPSWPSNFSVTCGDAPDNAATVAVVEWDDALPEPDFTHHLVFPLPTDAETTKVRGKEVNEFNNRDGRFPPIDSRLAPVTNEDTAAWRRRLIRLCQSAENGKVFQLGPYAINAD